MPQRTDVIARLQKAMERSKEIYLEVNRRIRDEEIERPLIGERYTKDERRAAFADMVANPANLLGVQDEMAARYRLPNDKPIPKRLVDYLERMFTETEEKT